MLEGLAGKIAARIAADEFAHAPPLLASASTADMGRDQHVGQVPQRARCGQRLFGQSVQSGFLGKNSEEAGNGVRFRSLLKYRPALPASPFLKNPPP